MKEKVLTQARGILAGLRSKGSFTQNLAVAFSSNALAFVITFLFTPIFSRIYTPEAYGRFSLFNSIAVNLIVFASLNYTNAFVLPRTKESFMNLARLALGLCVGISVLTMGVFLLFGHQILAFFNASDLAGYMYLIPVAVFLGGLSNIWNNWNLREKEFRRNGGVQIATSLSSRLVGLGYGLLIGGNTPGLILGDLVLKTTSAVLAVGQSIRSQLGELLRHWNVGELRQIAHEYRGYPLYAMPGTWISVLTSQAPVFLLSRFYGVAAVGQFSFANSLLNIPIQLIAYSMGPVFLQRATELHHENPERLRDLVSNMYTKVFYIGVVPFGIISVFGEYIFTIFLGKQWQLAGVFAGYMGYYYIFYMISFFLASLYTVLNKQNYTLLSHIINLGLMVISFIPGVLLNDSKLFVMCFSISSVLAFLANILMVFRLFKVKATKVLLRSWGVLLAVFVVLTLLRLALELVFPLPK
ncbi:oligosaccharide flippase family protein [Hymenobacter sp. BT18]|uniref:lipopolysaccharide biosynthesis protein n=1 Tax=Hymenobacter sp. BT18 TaxID=2835648 RepID=UPI00143E1239|nr:oligosaccharide flippase family protein [Hymenobacter sp. BT18]QIX62514.1 oligosaccharide flippase family protein [Hymenobacter sp. BT18]